MEYREHIEKVIEYIEDNLQSEISLAECAKVSGYSTYHFLRVFKDTVGLTPADYIRKRRIAEISREIMQGNRHISDIAFRYGFNSKENFIRAFKAEHHILPTEYKEARNSLKLYQKFCFDEDKFSAVSRIVEIRPFLLTVYTCDEDFVPNFWNKYNARGLSQKLSGGREVWDYGVSRRNHEEDRLEYYIGIRTEYALGDIRGTRELSIAGGWYAVFSTQAATQENFVTRIRRTWEYINTQWQPDPGYVRRADYEFECYLEKSRIFSEEIYIPLEREEQQNL